MENDDLYGAKSLSTLDELRAVVADVLNVTFELRESLYLGEYLRSGSLTGENLEILSNNGGFEEDGDEEDNLLEPDFPEYAILLRVNSTKRGDELKDRLSAVPGLDFLSRS